jgi:hypothetical protein
MGPMQRISIKKCFLFMVGSVCRVKRFTTGKRFVDDEGFETEVRKWLRQQSKTSAGFDVLVKTWDKCINVGGGHARIIFVSGSSNIFFMLVY